MNPELVAADPVVETLVRLLLDLDRAERETPAVVLNRAVLEALRASKTAYTVLHAWELLGLPMGPEAEAELRRLRARESILDRELAAVSACLEEAGVEYLLLRGHALGSRYPGGQVRQYNDVDLLLRYGSELPRALAVLDQLNYYTARPLVGRRQGGRLWAGVALNRVVAGLGHPMYLDLTTLGPGLDRTSALPLADEAWRLARRLTVGKAEVPILNATWQAVVFAVELVERDGAYLYRDVLDLCALHRCGTDWTEVVSLLAEVPRGLRALAELTVLARRAGLPVPPMAAPPARERALVPALRAARSRSRRFAVRAVDAGVAQVKRRNARLARGLVERFPTRPWFALGLPVFMLPPSAQVPPRGGTAVPRVVGLVNHRALVYPLVRPGYSRAAFAPSTAPSTEEQQ